MEFAKFYRLLGLGQSPNTGQNGTTHSVPMDDYNDVVRQALTRGMKFALAEWHHSGEPGIKSHVVQAFCHYHNHIFQLCCYVFSGMSAYMSL